LEIDKNGKVVNYIRKSGLNNECLNKYLDSYIYTFEYTKDLSSTKNIKQILTLNINVEE